jgi:hypothetical protein
MKYPEDHTPLSAGMRPGHKESLRELRELGRRRDTLAEHLADLGLFQVRLRIRSTFLTIF